MSLLTTASLVITPNAGEEGTLFSTIPDTGLGDMSVTRATTATRVNSQGLVELVPYNLFGYSEQFDQSYWLKSNSTITANNTTAPDGTLTADRLNTTGGYGAVYIYPFDTFGNVITASCYFKKGTGNAFYIESNPSSGYIFASFNLDTEVISPSAAVISSNIENLNNGWYRCSITAVSNGTSYLSFGIYKNTSGLTGYLWGAQVNEGTLKPYQKTETRLNIPRLDYSNGTCPSILVEPQRTNLTLYSEQLNNAAYNTGGGAGASVVVSANYGIAPDGNQTADRLQITRGTTYVERYQRRTTTIGQTYTLSFWGKAVTGTPTLYTCYNLGYEGPVTFTNEWVRYTYTFTALYSDSGFNLITWVNLPTTSATADVMIWGVQLEQGSYATSYIPTTSASVTRNADVISKTGISSLIGQTEGTLFVEFYNYANNSTIQGTPLAISNGGFYGNAVYFEQYLGSWYCAIWNGTSQQFLGNAGVLSEGYHKLAVAYKANDIAYYVDGNQIAVDTSATIPTCDRVDIGAIGTSTNPEQLGVKAAALWKTRLTNAQLATLTTI